MENWALNQEHKRSRELTSHAWEYPWAGTKCNRHFLLSQKRSNAPILMQRKINLDTSGHQPLLPWGQDSKCSSAHFKNKEGRKRSLPGHSSHLFFSDFCIFPLVFGNGISSHESLLQTMQPLALFFRLFLFCWQLACSQSISVCRQVGR